MARSDDSELLRALYRSDEGAEYAARAASYLYDSYGYTGSVDPFRECAVYLARLVSGAPGVIGQARLAFDALTVETDLPTGFMAMPLDIRDGFALVSFPGDPFPGEIPDSSKAVFIAEREQFARYGVDVSRLDDAGLDKAARFAVFRTIADSVKDGTTYTIDPDSLSIRRGRIRSVWRSILDAVLSGDVSSCPVCGKPEYTGLRANSTPFCCKAHYMRYKRSARETMEADGLEAARALFPLISGKTYAEWMKDL